MRRYWRAALASCVLVGATMAFAFESAASTLAHRRAPGAAVSGSTASSRSFGFIAEWPYDRDRGPAEGMAVDDSGDVYLVSYRVFRYTNRGAYVCDWGPDWAPSDEFGCGTGIAVDHAGGVYVLDECAASVWKFTRSGVPLTHWGRRGTGPGEFGWSLNGIATDDSGFVYVSDGGSQRVEKFTGDGEFVKQWGSPGTGAGQFVTSSKLVADREGHIFVADAGSPRIQEFTTQGEYLATWPHHADALALDGEGANLYALDADTWTIFHLDDQGRELDRWGEFGWEAGQFINPTCLVVQGDGSVLAADADLARVQQFGVADRWRIAAIAGPHGRIAPDTSVDVAEGMSQSYRLLPDAGYRVAGVEVDGSSVGTSASYTFSGVHADHGIKAGFAPLVGWPTDPLLNLEVASADGSPRDLHLVSDGDGGAIVGWLDYRVLNGAWTFELRVQHIDAFGRATWPLRGVCLLSTRISVGLEGLVADGSGGAIVLWVDNPNNMDNWDLHLQRVNGAGEFLWSPGGIPLCPDPYNQGVVAAMVADGSGGAIVAWSTPSGAANRLVAQRVDGTGAARWGTEGLTVRTHAYLNYPVLATDGAGGAFLMWSESMGANGICVQRIRGNGTLQWASTGVPVCAESPNLGPWALVADGSGGAIEVWQELRGASTDSVVWDDANLLAQRLDASGLLMWATHGVPVCTAPGDQRDAVCVADGVGGAFIAWDDGRSIEDAYIQHVSATGTCLWQADGQVLGAAGRRKWLPALVGDDAGGVLAAWTEPRGTTQALLAQRFDAEGTPLWPAEGVEVCSARLWKYGVGMTRDGFEGAIVSWLDYRDWYGAVFAQRVDRAGMLGGVAATTVLERARRPALVLERVGPNPHRAGPLDVRFSLASRAPARLELLDVAGRRVALRDLAGLEPSSHSVTLREPRYLAPGLYFIRLEQAGAACTRRIVVLR